MDIIGSLQPLPDVICLQEVTPSSLPFFLQSSWLRRNGYFISDPDGRTLNSYGVVMFVSNSLPLESFKMVSLPSEMDRSGLVATFFNPEQKPDTLFEICTVHLESLGTAPYRKKQLEMLVKELQPSPSAFILGDFNFGSRHSFAHLQQVRKIRDSGSNPTLRLKDFPVPEGFVPENNVLMEVAPDFVDTWAALHPDEEGPST